MYSTVAVKDASERIFILGASFLYICDVSHRGELYKRCEGYNLFYIKFASVLALRKGT
jgi:hypothetical protein